MYYLNSTMHLHLGYSMIIQVGQTCFGSFIGDSGINYFRWLAYYLLQLHKNEALQKTPEAPHKLIRYHTVFTPTQWSQVALE